MKKFFPVICILTALFILPACSAFQKPAPQQDKTLIVPEVTTVDFEQIDLKTAPKAIRDMARALEKQDATSWANSGNKSYLIISQGDKTKNHQIEISQILQRMPESGFTWLDVKLEYTKSQNPSKNDEKPVTIIRADVNNLPNGAAFTITGLTPGESPPKAVPIEKQPPATTPPAAGNAETSIKQPAANSQITSPVSVQGITKTPDRQIRVRIITRGGQIIKEESVAANRATGEFFKEIKYNPPSTATPGEIEVLATFGDDEKVLASIPVIIK